MWWGRPGSRKHHRDVRPLLREESLQCPNSPLTDLQRVRRSRSKRGRSQRGEESRNKSQSQAEWNWNELWTWQGSGPRRLDFCPRSTGWVARARDGGSVCTWAPGKLEPRSVVGARLQDTPCQNENQLRKMKAPAQGDTPFRQTQYKPAIPILFFFFNWRIIAVQNFVLCHTSTWISHGYTYIPSLWNLPSVSIPAVYWALLRCQARAQSSMLLSPTSAPPLLEAWLLLLYYFYVTSSMTNLWSFMVEKTPASLWELCLVKNSWDLKQEMDTGCWKYFPLHYPGFRIASGLHNCL